MEQDYWPADTSPKKKRFQPSSLHSKPLAMKSAMIDASVEAGFQKFAIYTDVQQAPRHVAKQLVNSEWTSKIGQYEDFQHKTLEALTSEVPAYGTIAQIMKKPQ